MSFPLTSRATSGACSWHGGVNCSKGRQADGTVYCNDAAWTDSIVLYEYTVKCQKVVNDSCGGYSPSCKYLNDLNLLENKKKEAREKIEKMLKGLEAITNKNSFLKSAEIDLTIKLGRLSGNYIDYMCNCLIIDELITIYGKADNQATVIQPTNPDSLNKKEVICPEYSHESNGKCICSAGFLMNNNECISVYEAARNSLLDAYNKIQKNKPIKRCVDGYQWDKYKNICKRVNNCPQNSSWGDGGDNTCYCNTGYEWNNAKTSCIPIENKKNTACPINSSLLISNNLCYCNFGYAPFNSKCVRVPEHAHAANNNADAWLCDDGFTEIDNTCVIIPQPEKFFEPGYLKEDSNVQDDKDEKYTNVQIEQESANPHKQTGFLGRFLKSIAGWFSK